MFYTPGWGAVLTVTGTLGGVIVTQVANAWSKREDRQHERALDYEKRSWQAKSNALARLISACRFVKLRAKGAENKDENHRRAATIRALDLFRERVGDEDGIGEVTAYAAEPVCKALEKVLELVDVQRREHTEQTIDTPTHWQATGRGVQGAGGRRFRRRVTASEAAL